MPVVSGIGHLFASNPTHMTDAHDRDLVALAISHATNSGHRVCLREPLALASETTPCVDADLAL